MAKEREIVTCEIANGMTAAYDIRAKNGHRLLTCVKSGSDIFLQGKEGEIELKSFLEQVFNPLKVRMKK